MPPVSLHLSCLPVLTFGVPYLYWEVGIGLKTWGQGYSQHKGFLYQTNFPFGGIKGSLAHFGEVFFFSGVPLSGPPFYTPAGSPSVHTTGGPYQYEKGGMLLKFLEAADDMGV